MKSKLSLILFFSLLPIFSFCQINSDSIFRSIESIKIDSLKADRYLRLSNELKHQDKLFAEVLIDSSINLSKKIGFIKGVGRGYITKGDIFRMKGDLDSALKLEFEAYKIMDHLNDLEGQSFIFNNIGNIFVAQGQKKEALNWFLKSLNIKEILGDKNKIATSYINLVIAYMNLKNVDSALYYSNKAINLCKEIQNDYYLSTALLNHALILETKNNYKECIQICNEVISIKKRIDDKEGLIIAKQLLATYLLKIKEIKAASDINKEAIVLAESLGFLNTLKDLYLQAHEITLAENNFQESLNYYIKYTKAKDSILNTENSKQIIEFNKRFELDQINKELLLNKAEASRQELKRKYLISGIVSLAILLLVILYSLLKNQKAKLIISKQKLLVENHQKEILDSIKYAQRIQKALLASSHLLKENLPEHFIMFKPKDIVSGDFYWGARTNSNEFLLITADSTGHGVPGAFMSLLNINFLNESINERKLSNPDEILNYTRKNLIQTLSEDGSLEGGKDGMDCVLCCFDFKNLKLKYSAANNTFYILRDGQLIKNSGDKMPVGKSPRDTLNFSAKTIDLLKGDTVYTFTDGFPDQFGGPDSKKFKYKRLEHTLIEISTLSMSEQHQKLIKIFEDWKGNLEQIDDVLIIGIKI